MITKRGRKALRRAAESACAQDHRAFDALAHPEAVVDLLDMVERLEGRLWESEALLGKLMESMAAYGAAEQEKERERRNRRSAALEAIEDAQAAVGRWSGY